MIDFFEIDETKKTIKKLNLDDFSIEDLKKYTDELNAEIERVNNELIKKVKLLKDAEKIFK